MVYNGSFELYDTCPNNLTQPGANQIYALGWYIPTFATSDYYHTCDVTATVGVPQNQLGYQDAHTGSAYAGIYYISGRGQTTGQVYFNYSEYLQTRLTATLAAGILYHIQLFVSRADSINGASIPRFAGSAVDQIGVLFSQNPVLGPDSLFDRLLPYTPSAESAEGVLLTDTTRWQEVNMYYVAQGNENYLTVGFFRDINSVSASYYFHDFDTTDVICSYYYLDDISIMEATQIEVPNVFTPNGDGTNDLFVIQAPKGLHPGITIYNRWGTVTYRNGDGPVAWDGTFSGNRCTDGTYYYVLEVKGTPIKQKGFIRLAR